MFIKGLWCNWNSDWTLWWEQQRGRGAAFGSVINLLLWECGCRKNLKEAGKQVLVITLLEEIMKRMHSWCLCRFMDVFMVFLWALCCVHALSIENTVSVPLGYGMKAQGKDTACWIQYFNSWNSLKNHFSPWDNTMWSLFSLNLMKAPVGSSISTWHHKSRQGAPMTSESVARHTHSEEDMDQALNRARNQHWNVTRSGKNQLLHYCNSVILTKQTQLSQRSFPILIMLQF